MNYKHVRTVAVLLFLAALFAQPSRAIQCTQSDAAGRWGFTLTGWLILPTGAVPAAAVGLAHIDAKGNVTGSEARNVGGGYADETLSGSLTMNSDCSGSLTVNFFESGQLVRTSVLSIVLDDDKKEIRMVQKSLTLPNGSVLPVVITVEARRVATED